MSQLKITAVEGLRTQSQNEVDHSWSSFYTDEHECQQEALEDDKVRTKTKNEIAYEDDFEIEAEEKDTSEADSDMLNTHLEIYSETTSTERLNEPDTLPKTMKKKRSKGKRPKTATHNKGPPQNLYQDELKQHLGFSRERSSSLTRDTMSDQESGRKCGRKLHRRTQMKKYHSLEQAVEQAGCDRLEQKFIELEELMSSPVVDKRALHTPHQQRLSNVQWRSVNKGRRECQGIGNNVDVWIAYSQVQEKETTDHQAYSTIHRLQTKESSHPHAGHKQNGVQSSGKNRTKSSSVKQPVKDQPLLQASALTSKPPIPQCQRRESEDISHSDSSVSSHSKDDDTNSKQKQNGCEHVFSDDEDDIKRFGNISPRSVYLPTDMHLKYSDNSKMLEWLKRKNTEYRQARKAERTKRIEQRNTKQSELEAKAVRREKSLERVKQWMEMKRKETAQHQKKERRKRKQEAQEQAALSTRKHESEVKGKHIERPQSAPSSNKPHIPIRRPESAARLENGTYTSPKPPESKFVYKRPVSGRVRLMKLQNEKSTKIRNGGGETVEELSPEEREKKMRMSYDAWLVAKRKDELDKRKEAKRQRDMIKSDPEMEHLIPALALRRIENIRSEKKSIETGVNAIDDDVNKRFGGGAFGAPEVEEKGKDTDSIPEPSSYSLAVEESPATLVELNTRARPTSAKTRMPIPQSAFSPRRPQSAKASRDANPKMTAIMDRDFSQEPNPYKLPFSDELGVPYHVQERIFSSQIAVQSNNSERPEPQGCASESAVCPKDVDIPKENLHPESIHSSSKSDTTPRSSLVLLQQIEADAVQSEQGSKPCMLTAIPDFPEGKTDHAFALQISSASKEDSEKEYREKAKRTSELLYPEVLDGNMTGNNKEEKEQDQENRDNNCKQEIKSRKNDEAQSRNVAQACSKSSQKLTSVIMDKPIPETFQQELNGADPHPEQTPSSDAVKSTAVDDSKNLAIDTGKAAEQERTYNSEAEESLRKSMKHVSFSEDLAMVYEPMSAETSSNFDDERGMDYETDKNMCVDDTTHTDPA